MTREEAIDEWIIPAIKNTWNEKKCKEILEALEQEPCEDCISREEVIDELNRLGRNAFKDDTDYDNFFACVDSLPSVTPQPKTGHWIEDENEMEVRCSECAEENDKCSNYCPNCGAMMADLADADAYGDYQQGFGDGLMQAVQIIDKYKAGEK